MEILPNPDANDALYDSEAISRVRRDWEKTIQWNRDTAARFTEQARQSDFEQLAETLANSMAGEAQNKMDWIINTWVPQVNDTIKAIAQAVQGLRDQIGDNEPLVSATADLPRVPGSAR